MNIQSWRVRRPVVIVTAVIVLIAAVCGGIVISGAWPGARASSAPGTQVSGTNVQVLLPGNVDPGKYHVRVTAPDRARVPLQNWEYGPELRLVSVGELGHDRGSCLSVCST